jgi:hypothetical protein
MITKGFFACFLKRTSSQDEAKREKMEKFTPPGTKVAPEGSGLPGRKLNLPYLCVG